MVFTYGQIQVGDEVVLKKVLNVKVTSVEIVPCKKRGNKVIVLGKNMDSGDDVREVKPADRELLKVGQKSKGKKGKKKKKKAKESKKNAADYDMSKGTAGAAKTVPIRAGEVKKGGYVMLKGKPCKVIEVSVSKTGKHGHAKANITGLDVFTGKKYNEISPTSHNMTAPTMYRSEWQLTDINQSFGMTLMSEGGATREDLDLPKGSDGSLTDLAQNCMARFNDCPDGKGVFVVVLKAMDTEQVIDFMVKECQ